MLVAAEAVDTGSILVPHTSASVSVARTRVERDLARCGLPAAVVDDSVLVVSEILSNALKHARPLANGKVRVDWVLAPARLALRVTDGGGATRPRVKHQSLTTSGGRGLGVVGRLSADWGVSEVGAETTVWAVIELAEAALPESSAASSWAS